MLDGNPKEQRSTCMTGQQHPTNTHLYNSPWRFCLDVHRAITTKPLVVIAQVYSALALLAQYGEQKHCRAPVCRWAGLSLLPSSYMQHSFSSSAESGFV